MGTRFEWDPVKAAANLRKHGVSFEIAMRAFADPFALTWPDRVEGGEQRWQTLGMAEGRVLLLVAHTYLGRRRGRRGDRDRSHHFRQSGRSQGKETL